MFYRIHHINSTSFTKPTAQIGLMFITIVIAFLLAFVRMKQLSPIDQQPGLQPLNTQQEQTLHVDAGFFMRNFLDFDILKNNFVADAYVWFGFDPKKISLKTIDDFYFGKATIKHKSIPYIWHEGNKTFVGYNVQIQFQTNLNYRQFPIDSHKIYLTLNNASLPAYHATFIADPARFQIAKTLYANGWACTDHHPSHGFQINTIDSRTNKQLVTPRVVFSCNFAHESFKRFVFVTLPLFIIFFLAIFTLSFDPERRNTNVLGVHAGILTALISYSFVIDTYSPQATYFMLSDVFFNIFLILCCMIFLFDELFIRLFLPYRGALVIIFHVLLLSLWGTALYWWL